MPSKWQTLWTGSWISIWLEKPTGTIQVVEWGKWSITQYVHLRSTAVLKTVVHPIQFNSIHLFAIIHREHRNYCGKEQLHTYFTSVKGNPLSPPSTHTHCTAQLITFQSMSIRNKLMAAKKTATTPGRVRSDRTSIDWSRVHLGCALWCSWRDTFSTKDRFPRQRRKRTYWLKTKD